MKTTCLILFYFLVSWKISAQDICLYALPDPGDSSNLVFYDCSLNLLNAGDMNGDGKDDVIASGPDVNFSTFQTFYNYGIMNGTGNGWFTGGTGYAPAPATGAGIGDFNEDGFPDYAVSFPTGAVDCNISNGSGGYNLNTINNIGYYPGHIAVADFDNDGHEDMMIGSLDPKIYFLHGNGNGSFAAPQLITGPFGISFFLKAADINNDGLTDIAFTGEIILNAGSGNFTFTSPAMTGSLFADINGDGNIDVISADSISLGSGYGNFPVHIATNIGAGYTIITDPVDLNNDNDPDLITAKGDGQGIDTICIFLGSFNAGFVQSQFLLEYNVSPEYSIICGDFDGNGLNDFVLARDSNAFEQCISILQPVMNYSASIIAPSLSVCQGDSISLAVNNTGQILWSTGDTTSVIYVSAPGNYWVTASTPAGCNNSDTVVVNQITSTIFSPINSSGHFCLYASAVNLNSGAPAGGVYSGPGVSNGIFDPQAAGIGTHTLTYSYNGPGGCTGIATLQVTVDLCLGTAENSSPEIVSVYPNPSDGLFSVSTDKKEFEITVFDVLGNIVYSEKNETEINVSENSPGIYLLRFVSEGNTYFKKIILK